MSIKRSHVRFQALVVAVGALLLGFKFLAYWLTSSTTILTDGLESIVNVVAGSLSLYSLMIAARPKDEDHPYGHGKVEFIAAGVEGTLIVLAGLAIVVEAFRSYWTPPQIQRLDWGLLIVALAGLVNYALGWAAERRGRLHQSLALLASGQHLKSDAYSTLGLVIGLAVIYWTDWLWLDSLIALFFGFIIAYTGYGVLRSSISAIMDEADFSLLNDLVEVLQTHRHENWMDIHNLRIIKYGDALHIDCHLTVPRFFTVEQGHKEVDRLEDLFREEVSQHTELFIHLDPCIPECCSACRQLDCPLRSEAFTGSEVWTRAAIMRNRKHALGEEEGA